jgi:hypothetical protein
MIFEIRFEFPEKFKFEWEIRIRIIKQRLHAIKDTESHQTATPCHQRYRKHCPQT